MTDHSEILEIEKTSLPDLQPKPVRKAKQNVSVLSETRYWKHYLALCHGNSKAATLLKQIVFRYQPKDDGTPRLEVRRDSAYWWYHSLEQWAKECDLKYEQVRYALRLLIDWGFVVKRSAKVDGVKVLLVRLLIADGAASLNGYPDFAAPAICENQQSPTSAICENQQSPTSAICENQQSPTSAICENQQSPTSAICEKPSPAICENSHLAICENSQIKAFKEEEGKEQETKILKPQSSATPLPANHGTGDSMPMLQGEPTPKPVKEKKLKYGKGFGHYAQLQANGHDMSVLLNACIDAGFVESNRSMLADTECSYLLRIEHGLKASILDDTLETFVLFAGKEWSDFCEIAEEVSDKFLHVPVMPLTKFDFLTKHMGKFFEWCKHIEEPAPVPSDQAPTPPVDVTAPASIPEPAQAATEPPIESLIYDVAPPPVFDAAEWTRQQIARAQKAQRDQEKLKKMLKEHAQATGKPMLPAQVKALQKQIEGMYI